MPELALQATTVSIIYSRFLPFRSDQNEAILKRFGSIPTSPMPIYLPRQVL